MSVLMTIAILGSLFILCFFGFCSLVYLSELKREEKIRDLLISAQPTEHLNKNYPVIIMNPIDQAVPESSSSLNKSKKDIN